MANKERFQNPAVGDTINLRLFSYNSNNPADFSSITQVDIYYLDMAEVSDTNPDGRRLVDTFNGSAVVLEDVGKHLLTVDLQDVKYVIGKYVDVWTVNVSNSLPTSKIEQVFSIYPDLWYTTPIPI